MRFYSYGPHFRNGYIRRYRDLRKLSKVLKLETLGVVGREAMSRHGSNVNHKHDHIRRKLHPRRSSALGLISSLYTEGGRGYSEPGVERQSLADAKLSPGPRQR